MSGRDLQAGLGLHRPGPQEGPCSVLAFFFDCTIAGTRRSSQRGFMLAWTLPRWPPLQAVTH